MKKVGITGLNRFWGRHLNWALFPFREQIQIIDLEKTFDHEIETVLHLASFSPKEIENPEEIYKLNIDIAKKLLMNLEKIGISPYIIFASSTQITRDNLYGRSKKYIGEMFQEWGKKNNSPVTNLIIPNEFGEGGVAYKTSVVSTFCHEILEGKKSEINENASVSLIHAQKVAKKILDLIKNPQKEDIELMGQEMEISKLYKILLEFKDLYLNDIVPVLEDSLHTALFNNLRWHVFESGFYPRKLNLRTDGRGSLFEMIKENSGGQIFVSSTRPGMTRGNHYHTRKIERFCVIKGEAEISLRIIGEKKTHKFKVNGDKPVYIDMPTFFTHNIKNIGKEDLMTIFWSNEIFNTEDMDTYAEMV